VDPSEEREQLELLELCRRKGEEALQSPNGFFVKSESTEDLGRAGRKEEKIPFRLSARRLQGEKG
jgi:hypothetical protein